MVMPASPGSRFEGRICRHGKGSRVRHFRGTGRDRGDAYSTVTDFARFLGWSTSVPLIRATW